MITGKGGMVAYLGTNSFLEARQRASAGDDEAKMVINAISYQVSKEIGAMAVVLHGKVDAIILTGGLAYDDENVSIITAMVKSIAPVVIYPGEDEMKALAFSAMLAIEGKIDVKSYE
jgi:butyrate kinase